MRLRARIDGFATEVNSDHDPEEFYNFVDTDRLWSEEILRTRYDDRGNLVFWRFLIKNQLLKNIIRPQIVVQVDKKRIITSSALPSGAATEATLLLLQARADLLATEVTLAALNVKVTACNTGAIAGSVTANAGTNLNTSLLALEAGGNLASIAGKDFATQTTLALIKAKTDNLDVLLSTRALEAGGNLASVKTAVETIDNCISGNEAQVDVLTLPTITQSTKHDGKVYATAIFDAAASGNLVAAVANKVTKLHALAIQAQGTVVVNLNNGVGGASLMEWSFQAREGAVLPLASSPSYWAITSVNTILYVTLSAAVQVTITAIVSSDDAS